MELSQLTDRLNRSGLRLMTLVGTAGIGKTRLALELASRLRPGFPDGVFLVSLAYLRPSPLRTNGPEPAKEPGVRSGLKSLREGSETQAQHVSLPSTAQRVLTARRIRLRPSSSGQFASRFRRNGTPANRTARAGLAARRAPRRFPSASSRSVRTQVVHAHAIRGTGSAYPLMPGGQLRGGTPLIGDPSVRPDLVPAAIAQVLGIREGSGRSYLDGLKQWLAGRSTLLVLDNFEHLLDETGAVSALLEAAPDLKVLVTSREPLGLYGEHQYPVLPLAVPDPEPPPAPGQLERIPLDSPLFCSCRSGQTRF